MDKFLFLHLLTEFDTLMIIGQWGVYTGILSMTPPGLVKIEPEFEMTYSAFRYIYGILWFLGGSIGIISFDCIPIMSKNDKILFFTFFIIICLVGKLIVGAFLFNSTVYHEEFCFPYLTDCMTYISIKQNTLNFFIIFCIRYIITIIYLPNSFIIFKNRIDYTFLHHSERTQRLKHTDKSFILNMITKTDSAISNFIGRKNLQSNSTTADDVDPHTEDKSVKVTNSKKRRHSYF